MTELQKYIAGRSIPNDYFGVMHAEMRTGVVTDSSGHRILGSDIEYLIFVSLDDARSYSRQKILDNPELECSILDDKKNQIEVIKNKEYIDEVMRLAKVKKLSKRKPWWKIW